MIKKLTKTGNSLALVLDKALLEEVGIDAETPIEVSTDGRVIVLSPRPEKRRAARIRSIVERLDGRFAGVFRRLAE